VESVPKLETLNDLCFLFGGDTSPWNWHLKPCYEEPEDAGEFIDVRNPAILRMMEENQCLYMGGQTYRVHDQRDGSVVLCHTTTDEEHLMTLTVFFSNIDSCTIELII
jgi:hypothetical protein